MTGKIARPAYSACASLSITSTGLEKRVGSTSSLPLSRQHCLGGTTCLRTLLQNHKPGFRGRQHHVSRSHIEVWSCEALRSNHTVIILMKHIEVWRVMVYSTYTCSMLDVLANHSCSKKALKSLYAFYLCESMGARSWQARSLMGGRDPEPLLAAPTSLSAATWPQVTHFKWSTPGQANAPLMSMNLFENLKPSSHWTPPLMWLMWFRLYELI